MRPSHTDGMTLVLDLMEPPVGSSSVDGVGETRLPFPWTAYPLSMDLVYCI